MKLPTEQECYALFEQYKVPKNILEHCKKVSMLATSIAEKLKAKGIPIDVELVRIGGLLHDWMKAATLDNLNTKKFGHIPTDEEIAMQKHLHKRFKGKHEGEIAYELLKDTYSEFAQFILKEGSISKNPFKRRNWEEKVVHYADWRILGTEIVPLSKRLEDFFIRYNKLIMQWGLDRWEKVKEAEYNAEREICNAIGVKPEEIK